MHLLTHTPQNHIPWNIRGCDLAKFRVLDISHGGLVSKRAMVMQQKTHQPVQFEIIEQTREAISNWIKNAKLTGNDCLFKSRLKNHTIFLPGNMPELLSLGYRKLDLIHQHMERTHFVELKLL